MIRNGRQIMLVPPTVTVDFREVGVLKESWSRDFIGLCTNSILREAIEHATMPNGRLDLTVNMRTGCGEFVYNGRNIGRLRFDRFVLCRN